jgi:ATP-dependent protease ClpP protease subunit
MKELYVRFFSPITTNSARRLLALLDRLFLEKYSRLHLLLASPGGSVLHGFEIYNFLKSAPFETYTYNLGRVDSIGVVIFCAGTQRFSMPHARFLIHGVTMSLNGAQDESALSEALNGLKADRENICRVIASTVGKTPEEIQADTLRRLTLNAEQARDYGLVNEVNSLVLPANSEFVTIQDESDQANNRDGHAETRYPYNTGTWFPTSAREGHR